LEVSALEAAVRFAPLVVVATPRDECDHGRRRPRSGEEPTMVEVTVDMDVIDLRDANNQLVRGSQVDNLQGLLKGTRNPAWDPGPIDGLGGPRTRTAVLAFQEDNTLDPDAIVGPLTWGELIASSLSLAVGLPPDDRPRTEPVDAFEEFAGLTPQPSFEGLVGEVVAQIERRRPEPEFPEGPTGTEVAWGHSDEERIIIVRRGTFGDDSVAGAEYTVGAQQSGDGWRVTSASVATICWRGVSGGLCV
jgi:peptidoglycan hydrolase-like protein with peptidoglycan-binding domain